MYHTTSRGEVGGNLTQFQIVGAAGSFRDFINGVFESTLQQCGGKPVYQKCDNSDIWMEHDIKAGEWNVLNTAHRGLSWGYASFKSQNDVSSFDGKAGWKIFDGKSWADQPGVRLKIIPRGASRFVVPEVPKQPPPQPPATATANANPVVTRVIPESTASETRCISPRMKLSSAEDAVVRHFDFFDSAQVVEESAMPNRLSEDRASTPKEMNHEPSLEEMIAKSSSSDIHRKLNATTSSLSSSGSLDGSLSSSTRSDRSSSGSQRVKNRRLHIDALEPGHPKVIMRVSNQQTLPVSSLSERMSDLNLQSVQTAAAIVDGISAERTCAKLCVWNTPRFSRVSEMVIDILLASGQRMEADEDVSLVREGEDISGVIYYVASGQIKFFSKSNQQFSAWCLKRSTVTHSIMVGGCVGTDGLSTDRSDATVMACAGAVVWRFSVPQLRDTVSSPHHLVINDELVMLRSLAEELLQVVRDQRILLVACEKENMTLQKALQVQSLEVESQTDETASSLKMERDTAAAERRELERTISDLRNQLSQVKNDHQRFSATQLISQLEQELAATVDRALEKEYEYEAHLRQMKALDQERQRALREALDARSEFELKNAILHELVQQLEIAKARGENEKRALAEQHSSLRVAMSAMEDRACRAEQQHSLLLHRINVELQGISLRSPSN